MAKKKKSSKKKAPVKQAPQHVLPAGFWNQVFAVILIALAFLLIVTWFGAGGPILEWLHQAIFDTVGYAVYILPALFIYLGVAIFRVEDNILPFVVKFASLLFVLWCAGLSGLLVTDGGGFVGGMMNQGLLSLVNTGVGIFIYVLFIAVTLLFVFSVSPQSAIARIWAMIRGDRSQQDANAEVMKHAAAVDAGKQEKSEFKLNAGVPTLDVPAEEPMKKSSRLTSLKDTAVRDKQAEERAALVTVRDPDWEAPSLEILEKKQAPADPGDAKQNAQIIKDTLAEFDINVLMEGANIGPKVTQYTLKPPSGVRLTKITALETNMALNLAAKSIRIEAPIPGQRAVGVEVPNVKAADVRLYGLLSSKLWQQSHEPLTFAIGKDISGQPVIGELNKMPHLLIAGQTNSGKSVMVNTLLTSLLYRNSPSEMRLILVDPKHVEMAMYNDIPHLLTPVITEPDKTISALKWAVNEMERRYKLLATHTVKDIKSYNQLIQEQSKKIVITDGEGNNQEHESGAMPYIVVVIDELADLMMMAAKDVEALIVRLAQKARAVGIHLVLATQSPRADVITGLIKANVPAKIAFTVSNQLESRIILDQVGAEKLLGQGDMLMFTPAMGKPKRVQGALVTEPEIHKIMTHLKLQAPPQYNDEVVAQPVQLNGKGGVVMDFDNGSDDAMYKDALRVVVESGKASASLLQRRLRVGYARAARLIETMEEQGVIGPADGARPRDVLISSLDELEQDTIPEMSDDDQRLD